MGFLACHDGCVKSAVTNTPHHHTPHHHRQPHWRVAVSLTPPFGGPPRLHSYKFMPLKQHAAKASVCPSVVVIPVGVGRTGQVTAPWLQLEKYNKWKNTRTATSPFHQCCQKHFHRYSHCAVPDGDGILSDISSIGIPRADIRKVSGARGLVPCQRARFCVVRSDRLASEMCAQITHSCLVFRLYSCWSVINWHSRFLTEKRPRE